MITRVLVPIADGFEELEAVTLVDTLRRADLEVALVSISGREVRGSRGVHVVADALWGEVEPASFDAVVLPGGLEGTLALAEHEALLEALRASAARGAALAALCAAPLVLEAAGLLEGRPFTCHPSVTDRFAAPGPVEDRVVADGTLVTSRGPGTALEFALALVARWRDEAVAAGLADAMVAPEGTSRAWTDLG